MKDMVSFMIAARRSKGGMGVKSFSEIEAHEINRSQCDHQMDNVARNVLSMGTVTLFLLVLIARSQAHDLYFLPSFQGTVLVNSGKHIHIAPLTPSTYLQAYSLLTDPATTISTYTEYPTATCAPFSHAGHCTQLPAEGPITELQKKYNVTTIPYDWRLPTSHVVPILTSIITDLPKGGVLLAHGTACRLATLINPRHMKLICLSPVSPELAEQAISNGQGLLTLGGAHHYRHPGDLQAQKDFRMMEHELGLVSKRRLLPHMSGPWDERDRFAAPLNARVELVAKLDSILEYSNGGSLGTGDSSLCVQGSGVGNGCERFKGRVLTVDIQFFAVVGLVDAVVQSEVDSLKME